MKGLGWKGGNEDNEDGAGTLEKPGMDFRVMVDKREKGMVTRLNFVSARDAGNKDLQV